MIDGLSAAVSVLTLQRATRPDRGRNPQLARGLRAGMICETEHVRLDPPRTRHAEPAQTKGGSRTP